ncbi:hypothetical protein [Halobacterium litoreum]|uniref:Restriction endonuclease n=1 Tax=Halobacterium litoreum TaxID=2039234 RepID=A0ABD5NGK3_9EURY|nr:hypothetical protein [Halobacterium litoreum]UHH13151.1 hypothetical protein LT972_13465 [Halobacterium litoreum]
MGEFADDVHAALRDALAARDPDRDWQTEWYVRNTPVDVAGVPDATDAPLVLVEVEVRRADPANNPVKLARYADDGDFDRPVVLVQAFTDYYALETGGVSSKRENATFVGRLAAETLTDFDYRAVDLPVAPPKRGDTPPDGWRNAVERVAATVLD